MVLSVAFLFGRHLLLTWVVAPVAGVAFGTPVDMEQASCAPTRRLDLSNLRVGDADDAFLTTGPVEARYRLWHSLFLGPYVEKLHAERLTVNLAHSPKTHVRLPRFRWFHRHHRREDVEDVERFLLRDMQFRDCTIIYARADSPIRFRLEHVEAGLPELRQGQSGRIEVQGQLAELAVGPLTLSGGTLRGHCVLTYDREMELLGSEFDLMAENLVGTIGEANLEGLTLTFSGTMKQAWGRGYEQDVRLDLSRAGRTVGTVALAGYFTGNLATLDLTVRLTAEAELVNLALVARGMSTLAAPRLELAVRGHFPRPGEAEVSLATNVELGGETVADLDFVTRSALPPVFQPARFRVTGERLAVDRLLAAYEHLRSDRSPAPVAVGGAAEPPAEPAAPAAAPPFSLSSLPPAILDLDLRGVSFGDLLGTLTGQAMVQGQQAELTSGHAQLGDGTLDLTGALNWGDSAQGCRVNAQAAGLAFGPISRQFLVADAGRIEGQLNTLQVDLHGGSLGNPAWREALTGTVSAELSGLELKDLKSLRRAAHKYRLPGLADLRFDQASLAGRVGAGRLQLDRVSVHGPSGWAELAGAVGLTDQALDLKLDAGLGEGLARDLRRSSKLGYLAFFLQPRDGFACLLAPLSLRGTLGSPALALGSSAGSAQ